jgi:hypothetical protein
MSAQYRNPLPLTPAQRRFILILTWTCHLAE